MFDFNQSMTVRVAIIFLGLIFCRVGVAIFLMSFLLLSAIGLLVSASEGSLAVANELIGRARVMLFPLSLALGFHLYRCPERVESKLWPLIMVVIAIHVLSSLSGAGNLSYGLAPDGTAIGVKGGYKGGNELSTLYALGVMYLLMSHKIKGSKTAVVYIGVSILGLFLATKTAIAFSILALSVAGKNILGNSLLVLKKTKLKKRFLLLFSIFMVLSLIPSVQNWVVDRSTQRLSALEYKYGQDYQKTPEVASVLSSGRLARLSDLWESYQVKAGLHHVIVGFGWVGAQYIGDSDYALSAEIDPVDTFFAFGLWGLLTIYVFWLYAAFQLRRYGAYGLSRIVFVLLALSVIPGHVIYSSLAPVILGLHCGARLKTTQRRESEFCKERFDGYYSSL